MNLFGSRKNKEEEIIVILDVGSASVGGMILRVQHDFKPEIIATTRIPVNFLFDVDFDAFWRCTADSLNKVIKQLSKDFPSDLTDGKAGPDKVVCVFSSPWFVSMTRIISVKRDLPFEIDKQFFGKLIDDEVQIFKRRWQAEAVGLGGEPEILECDIMKTALNGYPTDKPVGKKVQTMEASVYLSMGIKQTKEDVEQIVSDTFGDVKLIFHTFPLVAFNVLENIIKPEGGYLFADIGGEVSDVSVARPGFLGETVSFSQGRNFLVREVAAEFKTSLAEAVSLIERFRNKHANNADSKKIVPIIERVKIKWCKLLHRALAEVADNNSLPESLFLIGSSNDGIELIECAKDKSFSQFTVFGKPFNIQKIFPKGLKPYFSFKRSFEKDGDVFLMMTALFSYKKNG